MSQEVKHKKVTNVNESYCDNGGLLSAARGSCSRTSVKEKNKSPVGKKDESVEQKSFHNVSSPEFSFDASIVTAASDVADGECSQLPKCLRLESKNSSNDTLSLQLSMVREIGNEASGSDVEAGSVVTSPLIADLMKPETPRKCAMDSFEIVQTLGDGVSSCVFKVKHVSSGQTYALKRLRRAQAHSDVLFIAECNFLNVLKSQGVIKIIDAFADNEYFYMITELGVTDLYKKIKASGRISEQIAKEIIRNLLKTLKELHANDMVHRDIKAENVVFTDKDSNFPKIIDFGDAIVVKDNKIYTDFVGTQCYLAPERWRQHFGWELKASDIWAVGVLTYEMVTGKRCFYASSNRRLEEKIGQAAFKYSAALKPSPLCCHFISSLLTVNDAHRPTAELALQHPWLSFSEDGEVKHLLIKSWNRSISKGLSWTVYVAQ